MAMARSGEPAKTFEAYMIESMKHWRPVNTPAAAIFRASLCGAARGAVGGCCTEDFMKKKQGLCRV